MQRSCNKAAKKHLAALSEAATAIELAPVLTFALLDPMGCLAKSAFVAFGPFPELASPMAAHTLTRALGNPKHLASLLFA